MKRSSSLCRALVACAVISCAQQAMSCSLTTGYFYQVARLRGIVVGTDNYWPLLGYRSYPRWLRQRVVRGNVDLRLYEYQLPRSTWKGQPVVTVTADKEGRFDFGALPEGHYTLMIGWPPEYSALFDVEVKRLRAETSSVMIDVSPVEPDCTGGHEFSTYSTASAGTAASGLSIAKAGVFAGFVVVLFAPAVLILLGWRDWQRRAAKTQQWRHVLAVLGLFAASAAWLLLAALEIPMPFIRHVYGQSFIESFWRHSLPIGFLLSVSAIPFALFGRGHVRVYSLIGALGTCCWWWFLGLLD